ncbi:lipoxygenase family protein [Acaryochloris sp. IP29b_bin.148]|uniref:lipoxygenase family protein n=1 Tax=Acaryochloris sp. IP29b_bin.148 TaxID=2969218 RepID=UPI00260A6175|nr:lipoxygenase family protein [Acaryochloris sp. IP29b_bin.148]
MDISLPQNDPKPFQRQTALKAARQKYQYNYTYLNGGAMADQVPPQDQSLGKFDWIQGALSLLLRIDANQALQDVQETGSARQLRRFAWLTRIARYLNNPKRDDFLKFLLARVLPIIQWFQRLRDRKPSPTQPTMPPPTMDGGAANPSLLGALISEVQEPRDHTQEQEKLDRHALDMQGKQIQGSLSDYATLFQAYNDLFQIIYLPCISHQFWTDRAFVAQRVAGANPLVLEQCQILPDHFPVTNEQYQAVMGSADSLQKAGQEGRLYLTDYAVLDQLEAGTFPDTQKYVYAPLALFAVPATGSGSLVAVAIQCQQQPGPENPIFTPPADQSPQSEQWAWLMAKTIVQIADGNYHELISHLGRTHLLIEPIVVATYRQLAANHPLSVLLRPHFEGTLFINNAAISGLINDGGTVDAVMSGTIESSKALSLKAVQGFPYGFNDSMLPAMLAKRGVDNAEQLPDYPYRDDALLVWGAIHDWVASYLDLYYLSDEDVVADTELQAWLAEMIAEDGGRVTDIGETSSAQETPSLRTKAYLTDMVTLIIFTGSAQHAAVNFSQAAYMTYIPNLPLAGYHPAPSSTQASVQDYVKLLPSLKQAENQMDMTYLLGSLYYTQLGEYGDTHFSDARVQAPLQAFQQRLDAIGIEIEDRNSRRPTFYDFLHPNKIPQSINI